MELPIRSRNNNPPAPAPANANAPEILTPQQLAHLYFFASNEERVQHKAAIFATAERDYTLFVQNYGGRTREQIANTFAEIERVYPLDPDRILEGFLEQIYEVRDAAGRLRRERGRDDELGRGRDGERRIQGRDGVGERVLARGGDYERVVERNGDRVRVVERYGDLGGLDEGGDDEFDRDCTVM